MTEGVDIVHRCAMTDKEVERVKKMVVDEMFRCANENTVLTSEKIIEIYNEVLKKGESDDKG